MGIFHLSRLLAVIAGLVFSSFAARASAVNLLINGDFYGGTYSSSAQLDIGFPRIYTKDVPNGWTASPGYHYIYNGTGPGYVVLGNNVGDPLAAISQTFSDTAGTSYVGSLDLTGLGSDGGNGWFFSALLNGNSEAYITNVMPAGLYDIHMSFNFIGTGLDTLTLEGVNNVRSYLVSNVSVSAVPLPTSWAMMLGGIAGLLLVIHRKSRPSI